jgi:hypothetical protein
MVAGRRAVTRCTPKLAGATLEPMVKVQLVVDGDRLTEEGRGLPCSEPIPTSLQTTALPVRDDRAR